MVIGIVPNTSKTETLLNNLSEADFRLSDVSVIMSDPKQRDAIASDAGPFKGASAADLPKKLIQHGISQSQANAYGDAVKKGGVFVAIASGKDSESAAVEMLKDYDPQLVKVVHSVGRNVGTKHTTN